MAKLTLRKEMCSYRKERRRGQNLVEWRETQVLRRDLKGAQAHLKTELIDTEEPGGEGDCLGPGVMICRTK